MQFIQNKNGNYRTCAGGVNEEDILYFAEQLLLKRINLTEPLSSPDVVKTYLRTKMAALEYEVFACIFLDNRHRVIAFENMFRGTIDGASVPIREVVKTALKHNAAALILAHNHPSGVAEPSMADRTLTDRLKTALDLVSIRILDHFVVGNPGIVSFAERGLL